MPWQRWGRLAPRGTPPRSAQVGNTCTGLSSPLPHCSAPPCSPGLRLTHRRADVPALLLVALGDGHLCKPQRLVGGGLQGHDHVANVAGQALRVRIVHLVLVRLDCGGRQGVARARMWVRAGLGAFGAWGCAPPCRPYVMPLPSVCRPSLTVRVLDDGGDVREAVQVVIVVGGGGLQGGRRGPGAAHGRWAGCPAPHRGRPSPARRRPASSHLGAVHRAEDARHVAGVQLHWGRYKVARGQVASCVRLCTVAGRRAYGLPSPAGSNVRARCSSTQNHSGARLPRPRLQAQGECRDGAWAALQGHAGTAPTAWRARDRTAQGCSMHCSRASAHRLSAYYARPRRPRCRGWRCRRERTGWPHQRRPGWAGRTPGPSCW